MFLSQLVGAPVTAVSLSLLSLIDGSGPRLCTWCKGIPVESLALRACIGANRETPSARLNARLDTPPRAVSRAARVSIISRTVVEVVCPVRSNTPAKTTHALRFRVLCASTDGYAAAT